MRSRPVWRRRFIEAAVARRKLNDRTCEQMKQQVAKGALPLFRWWRGCSVLLLGSAFLVLLCQLTASGRDFQGDEGSDVDSIATHERSAI